MQIYQEQMKDLDLPRTLIESGSDHGMYTLHLQDGMIEIKARQAIFNMMVWRPFIQYGTPIYKSDVFIVDNMSPSLLSKINTHVYNRLLDVAPPDCDNIKLVDLMWLSVNALYDAVRCCLGEYHQTIDAIGLTKLLHHPKLKDIVGTRVESTEGSAVAEVKFSEAAKQLNDVLSDPHAIEDNPLLHLMRSGNVKKNQLPQIFIAYGSRDDIDGRVLRHIVNASALSGTQGIEDMAVEFLGARKALYQNSEVIKKPQHAGRLLRILASPIQRIYPGSCGNSITIPFRINKINAENCLDNMIVDGPNRVALTKKNIDRYIDQTVNLVSPITCRHQGGFCEACAGWGYGRATKYLPRANPGIYAITRIISVISQLVLSGKHLIGTTSTAYALPQNAKKFFGVQNDTIKFRSDLVDKMKRLYFRIPLSSMGPITDLQHDVTSISDTFSQIDELEIIDEHHELVGKVSMALEDGTPYFSEDFLEYMANADIHTEDENAIIPLGGFDMKKPLMRVMIVSADILAFVDSLLKIPNSHISKYTSVTDALTSFTNMLYTKAHLNIFWVQVLLKALLVNPDGSPDIPAVTDPNNVMFLPTGKAVIQRSATMKLAFEDIPTWLKTLETFTTDRGQSVFDPLFGLVE